MANPLSMLTESDNLYTLIGVPIDATLQQIQKAFRVASRTSHPDKGGDESFFLKLIAANDILVDPELRSIYEVGGFNALKLHYAQKEKFELVETEVNDADAEPDNNMDWVELQLGDTVPVGSEVRMDMSTGKTYILQMMECVDIVDPQTGGEH